MSIIYGEWCQIQNGRSGILFAAATDLDGHDHYCEVGNQGGSKTQWMIHEMTGFCYIQNKASGFMFGAYPQDGQDHYAETRHDLATIADVQSQEIKNPDNILRWRWLFTPSVLDSSYNLINLGFGSLFAADTTSGNDYYAETRPVGIPNETRWTWTINQV